VNVQAESLKLKNEAKETELRESYKGLMSYETFASSAGANYGGGEGAT
jgi:hypothetical protein